MNSKSSILIVAGEPNSIFLEIFFKTFKKLKIKKPLILIASHKLVILQMKKLNFNIKIKVLKHDNIMSNNLDNKSINLINVNYNQKKAFDKISTKSKKYIDDCLNIAFDIIKKIKLKIL